MTKKLITKNIDHFFRGAFSVDIVLITFHNQSLKLLLQKKKDLPIKEEWGLPGNLIDPNEDTNSAIDNLLLSLIGRNDIYKKQLRTFSELNRHPLGRIITFAYYGLIAFEEVKHINSPDLKWIPIKNPPSLSLDHNHILKEVFKRFQKGLLRHPNVFHLLPQKFILSDIISIYEQSFNQKMDLPNFRKLILKSGLVEPLGENNKGDKSFGRPAELFRYVKSEDKRKLKDKINFRFYA